MSVRHLAVIKETDEEFTDYFHQKVIHPENAQVFCIEGESFTEKSLNDLVAFDKNQINYSVSKLNRSPSITFFGSFVSLPEISRKRVVLYTDGACDIEEDPETNVNWAGPRAGLGVYVDVPNFKNHISASVKQEASLTRKEAKTVIEQAEAEALLAALILIRGYKYTWIVLKIDCLNVLHSIVNYISHQIDNAAVTGDDHHHEIMIHDHSHLTETFDKFFHVLFNGLPSGVNVILQKVKSHCGIIGNENADHLAKNGKKTKYTMLEMIKFIESFIPKTCETKEIHGDEWIVKSKGRKKNHCSSSKATTPVLNNPSCSLNQRRYRFWITYLPHCIESSQIEKVLGVDSQVSDRPKNSDFDKRDVLVVTNYKKYLSLIAQEYVTFNGGNGCPISLCCTVVPYVLQCDRCLQVGHFGKKCTQPYLKLCGICSESGHQHSACPKKRNVCYNCRQARLPADHSTFSNDCPQRLREIKRERARARKEVLRGNTTTTVDDKRKK